MKGYKVGRNKVRDGNKCEGKHRSHVEIVKQKKVTLPACIS